MTDKYIEITEPGQMLGLVEIQALKIDSVHGYPIKEIEIMSYTIVHKKTHKMIDKDASVKMYFGIPNRKYCWQIRPDIFSADAYYSDTIYIKPFTWYRLATEKYNYTIYFYLDKIKGTYISKYKPNPGAY